MSFALIIPSNVQQELADAINYYSDKGADTSERFLQTVDEAYVKLAENPQFYSYFYNSQTLRSIYLKPFPYSLVFLIDSNKVFVAALHNNYQNPDKVLAQI